MRARTLLALLMGCAVSVASAETIVVSGRLMIAPSSIPRPHRGQTMSQVEARFGRPEKRYPAVGAHPPITRWNYPGYSVYFEYNRVIDAVVHGSRQTSR